MGRFSTTVHIKNNADRMRFVNTFCDVMKKRGFVPCAEDEAAQSYLFAFGEGWVTLANEDYKDNPKKSSDDIREMSAALKTSAFSVEVVDSDFAIMTLCAPNGTEDRVVVGDGSGYDVPEMAGDRKRWEPLLADGKTWEQFSEAAAAQEVFVEDALGKVADVLGIDPYYIDADHDEVSEKADGNNNITAFYFKKAKSMSLNAAFVKVFGEALEPLGFKKIKYKYPYFVRIVGGEIINILTYMKMKGHPIVDGYEREDCSQYEIVCKIETVYSPKIDLPTEHLERHSSFLSKREIYGREHMFDLDKNYWKKIVNYFPYKLGDENLTISGLEDAVDLTKQILLPALDSAVDLDSYLDFHYKFNNTSLSLGYKHGSYENLKKYDGLVKIKVDTTSDSYLKRKDRYRIREFDKDVEAYKKTYANDPKRLAHYLEDVEEKKKKYISKGYDREIFANKMFDDKEWQEKALEELERRKAENTEILRSYGLDI